MRLIRLFALSIASFLLHACGAKQEITFGVTAPMPSKKQGDTTIYLSGNFNGWKPNDEQYRLTQTAPGQYSLKASFPLEQQTLLYKYTRGDWASAEVGPDGKDINNRRLPLAGKAAQVNDTIANWAKVLPNHTARPNVRLLHETFHIPQLDRQRRIWVYVPTGYEESDLHYPVIYMHDGQNLFDERYAPFGEWGIDESMNAIEAQFGSSAIIVGIEHGDKTRLDEYAPYTHEKHGGGEGKRYLSFIVNTLKPYIDGAYRTKPDRMHTAIGGSSMGGLISFCAGMYYPETFGKILAFSPSFWFSEEVYEEASNMLKISKQPFDIYISVGTEEVSMMVHGLEKMEAQLREQGFSTENGQHRLKVVYHANGKHNEPSWREQFPNAYKWTFDLE